MLVENLRVSMNGKELAVLCEEEQAIIIDTETHETSAFYCGWGDEENPIIEYVNQCDEILYIEPTLLGILTDKEDALYIDLTKRGISNLLDYVRR